MKIPILLTFDLEEFDLPLEYGHPISDEEQINVTNDGIRRLSCLLSKYNISATFFTTSLYAKKNETLIKDLSEKHEIASHSKYHSDFKSRHIPEAKEEIEKITGKQISGFRMPRFRKVDLSIIKAAGYRYDSSINPTFIPGRYNNFFANRKCFQDSYSNLIEIPVSVSPLIRFPLFWISFKIMPLPIYHSLCKMAMRKDSYLHLYFHPWEFADLNAFKIPRQIKNPSGIEFSDKFEHLIQKLMELGDFSTISYFLDSRFH